MSSKSADELIAHFLADKLLFSLSGISFDPTVQTLPDNESIAKYDKDSAPEVSTGSDSNTGSEREEPLATRATW